MKSHTYISGGLKMKKCVRSIAVLLTAVVMLVSFMAVPAYAAGITGDLPSIRTVTDGDNVTFSLAIDGTAVDVQWFRNGSVVASGGLTYSFSAGVADNGAQYYATVLDSENYVYTSNTCTLTVNPRSGSDPAPVVTPTPVPTATPSPEELGPPAITKHPTGETVVEGEYAIFIARADNATDYIWRLVSSDSKTTYTIEEACRVFFPLRAEGLGTERLVLDNIPLSLSGWKAECKFVGPGGTAWSKGALLTVVKAELKPPTINNQPNGFDRLVGESGKLRVNVTENNAGDLNFQWYCNTADSNSGGTPIAGATSYEFTPPQTEATLYYYVEIWSTKGDMESEKTVSEPAAVTYSKPEPTPTPTPVATPTPAVTEAPQQTSPPANDNRNDRNEESGSNTALIIFLIVAILGAIAAIAALVIVNRRLAGKSAAPKAAKSEPIVYYICDNCGWEPPDPNKLPRYCPQCGELFDEDAEE